MLANIIRNSKKTVGGGGGGIVIDGGDPYYSAVSLMLSMDGTNGSTTFTDSSLNALTVTPVGSTQISTTQSKYGGASGFFDGTGDYLSIAANAAINLSSSDFTIEFWIRPAPKTNAVDAAFGYSNYACMFYHNGINWTLEMSSTGFSNQLVISFAVNLNTWQHIAIVRYGTSIVVYKDGVSSATGTFSGTVVTSGRNLRIGDNGNSQNINGYIDDFRISRFARYASNFTPPTAALPTTASSTVADPYYNYTSLLLHMDGTNASTNFVDSGPNALTVTATSATISTTLSKYGGSSAFFNGSTGFLSLTGNSSFQFGTGDFTIEMWVYISANANSQQTFLDTRGAATATPFTFGLYQSKLAFYDGTMRQSSATVTTGQWYHFAACRSGGTLRLFIDGISYYSASNTTNFTTGANSIYIGRGFDSAAYYTNGYIDDLRITKYARFTSAFAPPAAALPDIYNPNTTLPVSGAALWLAGDDSSTLYTDAGSSAVKKSGDLVYQWSDKSGNGRNATQATSGNRPTWVAPASARNTLGAVGFNGSQWIDLADNTSLAFGTSDFTVECWIKPTSFSGTSFLLGAATNSFCIYFASTGALNIGQYGVAGLVASSVISTSTWTHIAVSRSGTSLRVFLNGTLTNTLTNSSNFQGSQVARIGWDPAPSNGNIKYNGQIQNLIIYKGQALYTANFTPFMS
jgi:hypothetical protein